MWTATYLPNGDHDKDGFSTEQEAIDWIVENCICSSCKDEGWLSACAAEWLVIETEKLKQCYTFGDILTAGGMEKVDESSDSGE